MKTIEPIYLSDLMKENYNIYIFHILIYSTYIIQYIQYTYIHLIYLCLYLQNLIHFFFNFFSQTCSSDRYTLPKTQLISIVQNKRNTRYTCFFINEMDISPSSPAPTKQCTKNLCIFIGIAHNIYTNLKFFSAPSTLRPVKILA